MRKLVTVVFAAMMSASAYGASSEVKIGETGVLRNDEGAPVLVFKSQDAISSVTALVKAKAPVAVMMPYVACAVESGTKAINITGQITGAFWSGADGTSDVLVLQGDRVGCKGVVRNIFFKKN
jgi:hypothetical protein